MNSCIVVIDDDVDTVDCLRIALNRQSYEVLGACSGADGLRLTRQHHADLVLTDVMMPDMDGFEVCRRLRADPATADTRIVMLSGRGALADRAAGLEVGADAFVVKPVSLKELARIINELLTQPVPSRADGGEGATL
jgi:two-component system cell cycle response regulator